NLATAGLGTDCGGSSRLPASFCNLVGIRPTPGITPRTGTGFLIVYQDTICPIARTVEDAVTVFDTIAGYDEGDPFSVSATIGHPPASYTEALTGEMQGARIGLVTNALGDNSEPRSAEVNEITHNAVDSMRAAGAEIIEVQIPNLEQYLIDTSQYIASSRHDIDLYLKARDPISHLRVKDIVDEGKYHPELDLLEAVANGPDDPKNDPDYTGRYVARD